MTLKRMRIGFYGKCALAIILGGVLIRLVLIARGVPLTDSDEATMDLMALHIVKHTDFPIVFYGQGYMGALEAYIGAALSPIFGMSIFTVRLGLLLWFALFLLGTYLLTGLLYTKRFALVVIGLLCLGSDFVIRRQLEAIGGYPEMLAFGALIFLIPARLAFSYNEETLKGWRWRRLLAYGLWGLVVGCAIWVDQLILPCIALAGLFLIVFCWRELLRRSGWCVLLGLLIGVLPLIIYNLHAPPGMDSLTALLKQAGIGVPKDAHAPPFDLRAKLEGTFLIALPAITGARVNCQSVADFHHHLLRCVAEQVSWSAGYMLLLACALLLVVVALWKVARARQLQRAEPVSSTALRSERLEQRQEIVRQAARLVLLLNVLCYIVIFTLSQYSNGVTYDNSRYMFCLLLSVPAVLWPLWTSGRSVISRLFPAAQETTDKRATFAGKVELGWLLVRICMLCLIALVLLEGTVRTFEEIPRAQAYTQNTNNLVRDLLRIGATRIYTDYWTCDVVAFASDEKIVCSDLRRDLRAYLDRYAPYTAMVRAAPHPVYVFPLQSSHDPLAWKYQANFLSILQATHTRYQRFVFDGYVVFKPLTPVPVPTAPYTP